MKFGLYIKPARLVLQAHGSPPQALRLSESIVSAIMRRPLSSSKIPDWVPQQFPTFAGLGILSNAGFQLPPLRGHLLICCAGQSRFPNCYRIF